MPGEPATRDDLRELRAEFRQELAPLKETVSELQRGFAVLTDWRNTIAERNRSIPGWLFNGLGLAIPLLAAATSWWLAVRFPGLIGGP